MKIKLWGAFLITLCLLGVCFSACADATVCLSNGRGQLTLLSGRLSQAQEHLRAVGPQAVLGRGYTIALRKGQAVASASQAGGDMTLIFRDGRANVRVQSVWEGDPFANEEGKANL